MGGIGEQDRRNPAHDFVVMSVCSEKPAPSNLQHARLILQTLLGQGLEDLYLAPGARSVPLVVAATECPELRLHGHFDERGLAFAALGHARTTGRPVAILTTSGSAVANLWPAVVEASYSCVPMVLLTADRPAGLRGSGANQTIAQPGIFGREVRWSVDLPPAGAPRECVKTLVETAWERARGPQPGPVHLNCPFAEPLLKGEMDEADGQLAVVASEGESDPFAEKVIWPGEEVFARPDGSIVVGGLPPGEQERAARELGTISRKLGWPLIVDALSGLKGMEGAIQHADLLVGTGKFAPPGVVLHIGGGVVTRALLQWLGQTPGGQYYHWPLVPMVFDPWGLRPKVCRGAWAEILPRWQEMLPSTPHSSVDQWQEADDLVESMLGVGLDGAGAQLSEPGVMRAVAAAAALRGNGLLIGNSMPVRHFQAFVGPVAGFLPVQGNRGASGIDGNVATLAGMNRAGGPRYWGILGDLAVLHDLNSLALLAAFPEPEAPILFVLNNHGGGIFPFLPLPLAPEVRERWLETPHRWSFGQAAAQFGLSYCRIGSSEQLRDLLRESRLPRVIEVASDRSATVELFRSWQRAIGRKIAASF
jgi:2-succinyl-5-enolpyruvyl-6-hydroxy-3-cyclohexene-1-carboxylate synthase